MQLGARWNAGEAPHRSVPESLHAEIHRQEAEHPSGKSWTLTWLEGRPRCALDGLVTITLHTNGEAAVERPNDDPDTDEDDDWLQ